MDLKKVDEYLWRYFFRRVLAVVIARPIANGPSHSASVRGGRGPVVLTRPARWVKNVLDVSVVLIGATEWRWAMTVRLGWAMVVFTVARSVVT